MDQQTAHTNLSKNGVVRVIKSILSIFYNEQSGPGVARHQGLTCATGKYILFADDDDLINWKNVGLALRKVERVINKRTYTFVVIESESQIRTRYDLEIFKNTKDNILKNFSVIKLTRL